MIIPVVSGKGQGNTKLSAFDAALNEAGIANHNLLYLSSVIPPDTEIRQNSKADLPSGNWGDKLYVVMAQETVDEPGKEAWAGIGWVQEDSTGKGLFVEHHGYSEVEVKKLITSSLKDLMSTRGVNFGEIHMQLSSIRCDGKPVCALVAAVYQSASW